MLKIWKKKWTLKLKILLKLKEGIPVKTMPQNIRKTPWKRKEAKISKINPAPNLRVPHVGWNQVDFTQAHPIFNDIKDGRDFYFVHSYFLRLAEAQGVCAATTEFGLEFCSAVTQDNVFATQFHPEKSAEAGLQLYANFLAWDGNV